MISKEKPFTNLFIGTKFEKYIVEFEKKGITTHKHLRELDKKDESMEYPRYFHISNLCTDIAEEREEGVEMLSIIMAENKKRAKIGGFILLSLITLLVLIVYLFS